MIAWSLALLADVQVRGGSARTGGAAARGALAIEGSTSRPDSAPRMESLLQLGLALVDAGEPESALKPLRGRSRSPIAAAKHATRDCRVRARSSRA